MSRKNMVSESTLRSLHKELEAAKTTIKIANARGDHYKDELDKFKSNKATALFMLAFLAGGAAMMIAQEILTKIN